MLVPRFDTLATGCDPLDQFKQINDLRINNRMKWDHLGPQVEVKEILDCTSSVIIRIILT